MRPFGLGRAGRDAANPKVLEHPAEVGGGLRPLQLLLEGPVRVVADEDVEAIAGEGQGQAVLGPELAEQGGIAVQILGGPARPGRSGCHQRPPSSCRA